MSKKEYSEEQIEEILSNPNVKTCSSKYITFTDEFKVKALELDKKHLLPREIFKKFWFPEYIINTKIPKQTLGTLRYKERNEWISWVISSKKGKPKKEKIDFNNLTKDEKIQYLETENAYLKELHKQIYWHYP